MTSQRVRIFSEVETERQCQDSLHGGPPKDDLRSEQEWISIAVRHLGLASGDEGVIDPERFRKQMIRVAALCVAAVESVDRKQGKSYEAGVYQQGSGF